MATNLAIDETLLNTAQKISGLKTKKETVNTALREFIQRRKVDDLVALFGEIPYDADYDYKRSRNRS